MTPEKHCVSHEIAERMARLGWPQEGSLFYWGNSRPCGCKEDDWRLLGYFSGGSIAAPTIGEILKDLPHEIRIYSDTQWNSIEGFWFDGSLRKYHIENSTKGLVNSFGKYWCWWKEKQS